MATETKIQAFIHQLEEGGWVPWIRFAVIAIIALALAAYFLFTEFRGLSAAKGMEQAQIAREIARGNGFTTKMIRPFAYHQLQLFKGTFPAEKTPDVFHAPLPPHLIAPVLAGFKKHWTMSDHDLIYVLDQVIAGVYICIFLGALGAIYLVVERLFDAKLATLTVGLTMVCNLLWEFAGSGLPQTLLLLLFALTLYPIIRAEENRLAARPVLPWLLAAGAAFGLLALANALTIWLFVGSVLFGAIRYRPRLLVALAMVAAFLAVYGPWLYRNHLTCGNAYGLGQYAALSGIRGTESAIMRSIGVEFSDVLPTFWKNKVLTQTISQLGGLYGLLGCCLVAPLFFVALLHPFRNERTAVIRWHLLLMWLTGLLGMGVFGIAGNGLDENNLHILFMPFMAAYGLAFVLVLWTRLEINVYLLRLALLCLVFLVSAIPLLNTFFGQDRGRVHWPPYLPPYIAVLHQWTNEREIIMSDMPWAVAWYADRRSLWLPTAVNDFVELNDFNHLGGRIIGLHLTPVSGNRPLLSEIAKGEFGEWAPFITRNVTARDFPLKAATALPVDNECIFYADRDRWTKRAD